MKRQKLLIIIASALLLLVGGWFFLKHQLNNNDQVKQFIQDQLPENIHLEYEKINSNVLLGDLSLENAKIIIKNQGLKIDLDELKINGLNYTKLLTSDTLQIKSCKAKKVNILVDKSQLDSSIVQPKKNRKNLVLKLNEFDVDFESVELRDSIGAIQARMTGTNLGLNDLVVQSKPQNIENQLKYAIVDIESDSIELPLNQMQTVKIGKLKLDSTSFKLNNTQLTLKDKGIDVEFNYLRLDSKELNEIFRKDTILFEKCFVSEGDIKINNSKKQTKEVKTEIKRSGRVFLIKDFEIKDTNFEFLDRAAKPLLKFTHTDAFFQDLKILTAPKADENSINYTFIKLLTKDIKYPMDDLHTLTVKELLVDSKVAKISQLDIKPNYNKKEFQNHIKQETDVIDLSVPTLNLSNYDFSFDDNHKFLAIQNIDLNQPFLSVYKNKAKADPTGKKPLFSETLRKLKFELRIDQIKLNQAKITYEEALNMVDPPGKLFFTDFNGTISNLYNKDPNRDNVKIAIQTQFMGNAPTTINWDFHVLGPPDKFTIAGTINNLNSSDLDYFLIPNMKAKLEGNIQKTSFSFTGNDYNATGTMKMDYTDLSVEMLNQKKEKKKLLSTIANYLVKNKDKDDPVENHTVNVARDQEKSFFNFFWLCLKDGLKQNILKFQGNKDKKKD